MLLSIPGQSFSKPAERKVADPGLGSWLLRQSLLWSDRLQPAPLLQHRRFADKVITQQRLYASLTNALMLEVARDISRRLRREGLHSAHLIAAMALASEAIWRETRKQPYHGQIVTAHLMLCGNLAEMQTGEGKSFAISLTALCAAMAGIPPHVITANDYLVERDAIATRALASRLGLSVGSVVAGQEPELRQSAYRCDITFCTARELVFDYLRDRVMHEQKADEGLRSRARDVATPRDGGNRALLRGLHMAIIDEADSILLDEAVTPFVLSQPVPGPVSAEHYQLALEIASTLKQPEDFQLNDSLREIHINRAGNEKIASYCASLGSLWGIERFRNKVVEQALAALHLFQPDRDYLIREGEIHMIDAVTGRIADGRKWSQGLHQLIELKELLEPTDELQQIGKMTYQRFFPRFLRLCGTSATLTEARAELRHSYNLRVVAIPPRLRSQRKRRPPLLFPHKEGKWAAAVSEILTSRQQQRPVLAVVDSVAESQQLSLRLLEAGIAHVVLNARQDAEEAATVARAGQPGQVTVATNMAGRGTDIQVPPEVLHRGGLHVISCQRNAARRIDRQIAGRCARNGQPGEVTTLLSLEDDLLGRHIPAAAARTLRRWYDKNQYLPAVLAKPLAALPQRLEEYRARALRNALRRYDTQMRRMLSLSGPGE